MLPCAQVLAEGGGAGGASGKPSFAVTTPETLVEAIRARLAELGAGAGPASEGRGSADTAAGKAPGAASRGSLPSGEDEGEALQELLEVVRDYDERVFSKKGRLERLGHGPGPW